MRAQAYGTFEAAVAGGIESAAVAEAAHEAGFDALDPLANKGIGYVYEMTGNKTISGRVNYATIAGTGGELADPMELAAATYGDVEGIRYLGAVDAHNYAGHDPEGMEVEYRLEGRRDLVKVG